jgi:hypothetical protein
MSWQYVLKRLMKIHWRHRCLLLGYLAVKMEDVLGWA